MGRVARRWLMAALLAAGLVSLAGCEYLLILALHRTAWVDLRYEGVVGLGGSERLEWHRWEGRVRRTLRCTRFRGDAAKPDFIFVRVGISNEVSISPSGVVRTDCRRDGEQEELYSSLLRRHPAYEDVYCEVPDYGHWYGSSSRDKVRLHGSYVIRLGVGSLWSRRHGETRETFLRRPFGLRCRIRGGEMYTLTLRSNEIVIPAADLVRAISAHRAPAATPR